MTDFDPTQHRMVAEQRWFDDFKLGERFLLPSRTMTEAVFLAFSAASVGARPAAPTMAAMTQSAGSVAASTWASTCWRSFSHAMRREIAPKIGMLRRSMARPRLLPWCRPRR